MARQQAHVRLLFVRDSSLSHPLPIFSVFGRAVAGLDTINNIEV